jgi:hypothetical protein
MKNNRSKRRQAENKARPMFKMDSLADNGLKADQSTSQREVYFEQKHHTQRHNLKFKNLLSPIKIIILASPYIIILLNNKKKKKNKHKIGFYDVETKMTT